MPGSVLLRRDRDGVVTISPADAPTADDPGLDTLVLEVVGGQLSWRLLTGQRTPAAVLHDPVVAQDWLWAVYGESVAVAVGDGQVGEIPSAPVVLELTDSARRLGYAHWAAHWWPASTIDGIPALDPRVLDQDFAALTEACEMIVDGADALLPHSVSRPVAATRRDYALAAGPAAAEPAGLILATGTTGWDWRLCPPGVLDASESAVTWRLARASGVTTLGVTAVAAPHPGPGVPAHLWPRARVATTAAAIDLTLRPAGDTWRGTAVTDAEDVAGVNIYVPGVGPAHTGIPTPDERHGPAARRRVRDFAVARLRAARRPREPQAAPLLAEIDAATADPDF
ncbi:hypothetical protein [Nocardia wallacei]|uniref:Uncharacterized protein n=1 Tax=Nocardia wallacei TaxID=480035 RepID=A0A7G1KJB7_9NOCA|nr:hypothetical protein [Nocardia wallacei]BCK55347.1 hypothetical protein NWFMUON74_31190 [Nocardia wallacei]